MNQMQRNNTMIEETSQTKINKQFKICSNNMENNHDLYEVFDYFVESCRLINIPTLSDVDWINTKLGNYETDELPIGWIT